MNLIELDPGPESPRYIRAIVEIPKGSSNKYEYDGELGLFKLSRTLYSPMHYPADYGFVPGTMAEDRDPLDILVFVTSASYPGIMSMVRPIGVMDMLDGDEPDHKIIAVPHRDPRFASVERVEDLAPHSKREIEHFFSIYKELEGKQTTMQGWRSQSSAFETITESRQRFLDSRARPS